MPRGPKGEERPADVVSDAVPVMRVLTARPTKQLPQKRIGRRTPPLLRWGVAAA